LGPVQQRLHAAVQGRDDLIAVATEVLHRKRRHLVPMLDAVVLGYCADALGRPELLRHAVDTKQRAAEAAGIVLTAMRADLLASSDGIDGLRLLLEEGGYCLTPLRIMEVPIWSEVEPSGYYRATDQSAEQVLER